MRILHTSDWHLGRSFHGHSTEARLRDVLGALPGIVREYEVDVVLVAGDVFDHAAPAAGLYTMLADVIRSIRRAGAEIVLTSGNHDNAMRLGFQSEWASLGGVHVLTQADTFRRPLTLHDSHGAVDVYGIPYLEPMLQRGLYPGEMLRSHESLLARVMGEIDELRADRGHRSVVMSHCFAANVAAPDSQTTDTEVTGPMRKGTEQKGTEQRETNQARAEEVGGDEPRSAEAGAAEAGAGLQWDLTAGGVDLVPASIFEGHDYVALGHLHGRVTLAPNVRYSGAPLHFSFKESQKPRGAWLVDLGADGVTDVSWVALPVPKPLARLHGTLQHLLEAPDFAAHAGSLVEVTLTDTTRPIDAMRRLRERFPFCARIEFAPVGVPDSRKRSYASRVAGKSDTAVIDEFLQHVRAGQGADDTETELLREVLAEVSAATPVSPEVGGES